jgi:hypothetical protein
MRRLVIGDIEILAEAKQLGSEAFVSSVTVLFGPSMGHSEWRSVHEWEKPLFESEADAAKFAWRRAITMARSINDGSTT